MNRRKILSLVLACALIAGLAVPGIVSATPTASGDVVPAFIPMPDAYEDADDTTMTAPALPAVSFHTAEDGDDDWSTFTVEDTGTPIWIEATRVVGGGQGDLVMSIFVAGSGGSMTEIALDDDYETNWGTYDELIYRYIKVPGTYYVRVYSDNSMTYKLTRTEGIARRVAGANRYATSVAVSQLMRGETDHPWWGTGYSPNQIVIANGDNFPDALAGVVLASYHESVLLLTKAGTLPAETKAEIERLGMSNYWNGDEFEVLILGGESAVSKSVADQIGTLAPVTRVRRISGANRHDTAAEIAIDADDYVGGLGTTAFVVSGRNFPDALAAGPVAAAAGGVVLTTEKDTLPDETADVITQLGFTDLVLVGGASVITSDVADAIEALPGSPSVTRIAGADRYETALKVAREGVDVYGMNGVADNVDYGAWDGQSMVLVSGANFPDALSAGVMCWYMGSPMLLTNPSMLSEDVMEFLDDYGWTEEPSYLVGGEVALSPAVFNEFTGYWTNWPQ